MAVCDKDLCSSGKSMMIWIADSINGRLCRQLPPNLCKDLMPRSRQVLDILVILPHVNSLCLTPQYRSTSLDFHNDKREVHCRQWSVFSYGVALFVAERFGCGLT
ncbi:hypothetical protein CDAR_235431 [Caerostris darwini]|uniref:Uncharacterized protein n=1 Tax=Caerostris darwini TaxID=1538125 RepID=A0AAV4NA69_9ARAC|nr:hypothetical protein CDAR_235431 [Caerostris darwini]